jgi:hypothetical protein
MTKLLELFEAAVRKGASLLLYKGPDVDAELDEARKHKLSAEVICRYELPDALGTRSVVRVRAAKLSQAR